MLGWAPLGKVFPSHLHGRLGPSFHDISLSPALRAQTEPGAEETTTSPSLRSVVGVDGRGGAETGHNATKCG